MYRQYVWFALMVKKRQGSVLMYAAETGNANLVAVLLSAGAKVNVASDVSMSDFI